MLLPGLLISNTEVSSKLNRRYFFNIAQGIANTFQHKYRMLYQRYFFWSKIRYLSDTFLLKIIFLRLNSFFDLGIRDVSKNQDFGVLVYILR